MKEVQNREKTIIQPLTKPELQNIERIRYVPYIEYKNGIICPYDVKIKNKSLDLILKKWKQ